MNWTLRDRDTVYPMPDIASPLPPAGRHSAFPSRAWLLVVFTLGAAWGLSGGCVGLEVAEASGWVTLPPEIGPCSPVEHLCSVDPMTLEPVNRWTYACPWGDEVRELPWPCSGMKEERPPSETEVIPALVFGPCYLFVDICADGHERDWVLACTGPARFQWASPMGKVGEVCDV